MKEQSASGILGTSIEKIKDLVDVSTIIGDPMDLGDGIKIIPVSKVSYGFASGGSDSRRSQTPSSSAAAAEQASPLLPSPLSLSTTARSASNISRPRKALSREPSA